MASNSDWGLKVDRSAPATSRLSWDRVQNESLATCLPIRKDPYARGVCKGPSWALHNLTVRLTKGCAVTRVLSADLTAAPSFTRGLLEGVQTFCAMGAATQLVTSLDPRKDLCHHQPAGCT
jgi:hypothetical protein